MDIGPVFQKRHEPVSTTIRVHLLQLLISKGAIIRKSSPSDLSSGPQDLIDTRRTRKEKNAQQSKNCARIIEDHIAADCDGVVRTVVVPTEHDGDERRSKRKRRVIIRNGC